MSSSVHIHNKGKDILILGEGPTQGLVDTKLTAEVKYPINFIQSGERINATKIMLMLQRDYSLCLGKFQKILLLIIRKNSIKKSCKFFFS